MCLACIIALPTPACDIVGVCCHGTVCADRNGTASLAGCHTVQLVMVLTRSSMLCTGQMLLEWWTLLQLVVVLLLLVLFVLLDKVSSRMAFGLCIPVAAL